MKTKAILKPFLISLLLLVLSAATVSADGGSAGTLIVQPVSGGPIYAIEPGGGELRYLTHGIDPALSPDGQQVAFTRWDDVQNGATGSLWVINIDGTGERQILGEIRQPKSPTWSADGSEIVISMQHGGWLEPKETCGYARPPRNAEDIKIIPQGPGSVKFCYTLPPHPGWGLRVVNVASGAFEDLPHDAHSFSPTWNPSNDWQVVYQGDMGLVNLDLNRGVTWALNDDVRDNSPVFSPDGTQIATAYKQHDHYDLHLINADGSRRVQLTKTPLSVTVAQRINGEEVKAWNNIAPAWSPDGAQIAFLTDRTGRWEVWLMNADGSNPRPMFSEAINEQLNFSFNEMDERLLSWR